MVEVNVFNERSNGQSVIMISIMKEKSIFIIQVCPMTIYRMNLILPLVWTKIR